MRLVLLFLCGLALEAQTVWFEPNRGQSHFSVQFLAHTRAGYIYIGRNRMTVRDVRMDLFGSNPVGELQFEEPTGGISSYFIGRNEAEWRAGIPHYNRVRVKNVYTGIDIVYYGKQRDLEYDFVIHPGANPGVIKLAFNKPVHLNESGDLLIAGLKQRRPKVIQGGREIPCNYLLRDHGSVQLALAEYDSSSLLTIDPALEFSTYLGGPGQELLSDIKVDPAGNIYVAGSTQSPQSPALNPFQQSSLVAANPFVMKLSNNGARVTLFAIVGANNWDHAFGLGVDHDGSMVLSGYTTSANFPLKNPFQASFRAFWGNAFISKLAADGRSLVFSTFYGGTNDDRDLGGLAMDSQGSVWISGYTDSRDLPLKNAAQSELGGGLDCFLAKVSGGGALLVSTYWGGSALDTCLALAVDAADNVYIGGSSASTDFPLRNAVQSSFSDRTGLTSPTLAKFLPDGRIVFSTFLGNGAAGDVTGIAFDNALNVYLTGDLVDSKLIATQDALQKSAGSEFNAFFLKLNPAGSNVLYSTYLGGSKRDVPTDIKLDANGFIYVYGGTSSPDFPVKNNFQSFRGGGYYDTDTFVTKLSPTGNSIIYSTFFGGSGLDNAGKIAVDSSGSLYAAGSTASPDFPVRNAFQSSFGGDRDGFLFKISDNTPPPASPLVPSPPRLLFQYVQGAVLPGSQTVAVVGGNFNASTSVSWLNVIVAGSALTASVNPAGLGPGVYNAAINLVPQAGSQASVDVALSIVASAAVLTSIEPSLVPVGSDDTVVTIHGSGFSKNSTVLVTGGPWTGSPVQFVDSSTLKFSVPASYLLIERIYPISVQNPQSAVSNVVSLSVGIPAPSFTSASVVNAASFTTGPVAPGEIVTIFGTNFAGNVTFDGSPATVVYSSPMQISATVPYSVLGPKTSLRVGSSVAVSLDVAPSAPGIFAAVGNGDGTITLYATGCGTLTQDALPLCQLPVTATVNGEPAQVLYAGIAPGLVQGANQVNVMLPSDISSGSISIVLSAGTASSKAFSYTLP